MQLPPSSHLDFTNRVVLVTGGTKGVGKGIAEQFLQYDATVIICGRNEPETAISVNNHHAIFMACDVCSFEAIEAMINAIIEQHGHLDVLVNNAGGAPYAEAANVSPRFSKKIIDLNLLAPLYCAQLANKAMQQQDHGGNIINIASVSATRPSPGTAAYGAAKAGLMNLTTSLAVEWAPKVRLNSIIAGLIQTEQSHLHYGDEQGIAKVSATIPLGRMASTHDIGNACLYLASDLASYVTGAALTVHGGGEKPAFLSASNTNQ